ncbi:unnamed protein product [Sphagnum jensenii]|uniref:Uncharacterized protein n=1 Tax=Sphagnum jensenii TaxID=128206 RepID=A0ABP0VCZ6_9BRYO
MLVGGLVGGNVAGVVVVDSVVVVGVVVVVVVRVDVVITGGNVLVLKVGPGPGAPVGNVGNVLGSCVLG